MMKSLTQMRNTFLAAALMVTMWASPASAGVVLGNFQVEADGTTTQVGLSVDTLATVTSQTPAHGFATVTSSGTLALGDPAPLTGSFTLDGTQGSLTASFSGLTFFDVPSGFASTAGTFTITGGTGDFAGLSGSGVFNVLVEDGTGDTHIHIAGVLVPAPGALAMLGVAGIAGRRRRRTS